VSHDTRGGYTGGKPASELGPPPKIPSGATFPDHTATLKHVVDVLNGVAPGCALTEDTDSEAFAALPDCRHCEGTGKDLAGSPWETITEEDQ
jgi:hypothetical protein